jgi:hypothetical protein
MAMLILEPAAPQRVRGEAITVDWYIEFAAKNLQAADVIAVFVRQKYAIELLRRNAALFQPQRQLSRAQPGIDQNLAVIGRNQRAVTRAPATEHGQAEHGSQVSRVISVYANGNQALIATMPAENGGSTRAYSQSLRKTKRRHAHISHVLGVQCVFASLSHSDPPIEDMKWPSRHDAQRELHSAV